MPKLTDLELLTLKSRVTLAMGSNTFVAGSNDYLISLIDEVQESRKVSSHPLGGAKETLHISEMTVTHVGVPKESILDAVLVEEVPPPPPEKEPQVVDIIVEETLSIEESPIVEPENPSSTISEGETSSGEGFHTIEAKVEEEEVSTPCGDLEQEIPQEPPPIEEEKKVAKGQKAKSPRR